MTDPLVWLDGATVALWIAMALVGVARRLVRLRRLRALDGAFSAPADRDYLASVVRSTHLRLYVKVAFLAFGGVGLLTVGRHPLLHEAPLLFLAVRLLALSVLAAMLAETISVDRVRERLARRGDA